MAAATLQGIARHLLRITLAIVGLLALIAVAYPLAGWIGSSIPANDNVEGEKAPADLVEIMVETNGTHTGIIVPIVTAEKDWRETLPSASQPRPDGRMPTHLSIGWGEREVFLHVPTWGDLRPGTALRIATVGGHALMRVSHYVRPAPSPHHRPLQITIAQYRRLVAAIENALPAAPADGPRQVLRGSYADDAYYDARGTYTLVNTCNTWVGRTLAEAGIEMGLWTPFAGGVMKWIPEPEIAGQRRSQ